MRLPQALFTAVASTRSLVFLIVVAATGPAALAVPVVLQNATATHTQGGFFINQTIDGNLGGTSVVNGWALDNGVGGSGSETAVYETQTNLGGPGGTAFTFTLTQNFGLSITMGKFRLSVTTDDRGAFADGLGTGGDVTANWRILGPSTVMATGGATLTIKHDGSVLASGASPAVTVYTVTAATAVTNITGIRIEALEDSTLPALGPGRAGNGNLVLQEFTVDAVGLPDPPNADFDENDLVDGADLARWRANFGTGATHLEGNANAYLNSKVDGGDFLIWQQQVGSPPPAAAPLAVIPEPTALSLFAAAGLGSLRRWPHRCFEPRQGPSVRE